MTCPACGEPLERYGCVDVEQVGSFCRGPKKLPPWLEKPAIVGGRGPSARKKIVVEGPRDQKESR